MAYAALKTAMSETENEIVRLRSALTELTAIVRGECGSLLDEDRGGSASLSMEIDDLLGPNVELRGRAAGEGPVERSGTNLSAGLGGADIGDSK